MEGNFKLTESCQNSSDIPPHIYVYVYMYIFIYYIFFELRVICKCPFNPKYLNVYFLKTNIFLHNCSPVIKIRKLRSLMQTLFKFCQ